MMKGRAVVACAILCASMLAPCSATGQRDQKVIALQLLQTLEPLIAILESTQRTDKRHAEAWQQVRDDGALANSVLQGTKRAELMQQRMRYGKIDASYKRAVKLLQHALLAPQTAYGIDIQGYNKLFVGKPVEEQNKMRERIGLWFLVQSIEFVNKRYPGNVSVENLQPLSDKLLVDVINATINDLLRPSGYYQAVTQTVRAGAERAKKAAARVWGRFGWGEKKPEVVTQQEREEYFAPEVTDLRAAAPATGFVEEPQKGFELAPRELRPDARRQIDPSRARVEQDALDTDDIVRPPEVVSKRPSAKRVAQTPVPREPARKPEERKRRHARRAPGVREFESPAVRREVRDGVELPSVDDPFESDVSDEMVSDVTPDVGTPEDVRPGDKRRKLTPAQQQQRAAQAQREAEVLANAKAKRVDEQKKRLAQIYQKKFEKFKAWKTAQASKVA